MIDLHVHYLLLGAGLASSSAAQAIRDLDRRGSILMVGQESTRPYHRPPLSKEYLRGDHNHRTLFTNNTEWFKAQAIEMRSGVRASHLDTTRHLVMLDDGTEILYDKLLIATGGSAKHLTCPGAELPNLYYLRTLTDADRLVHAIDQAKREGLAHEKGRGRACVIGAGVLGVELAATLTQMGLKVDLMASGAWPWARFAGETTGAFVAKYLQNRGVTLHLNSHVQRLEGDGRVQRVALSDGSSLETNFAVAAVGMNVNKELLRGTTIAAEKAILTDPQCMTSVGDVYAAGDCAAIFDPLFGKHRILDHWENARVTGNLAGRNMADANERYSAVNSFFSDVFDLSLNALGEHRHTTHRLIRGITHLDHPDFIEIGLNAAGQISQILIISHGSEGETLEKLVRNRINVTGKEEALKDPAFDLASLLQ